MTLQDKPASKKMDYNYQTLNFKSNLKLMYSMVLVNFLVFILARNLSY